MVKFTVREVAEARGFKNARQLGEASGLYPATIYRLWGDTATRIDRSTIDALCSTLRCEPGLLIKQIPNGQESRSSATRAKKAKRT